MYQDKPPIEEVMALHHAGVGHDGYTLAGDIGESGRYKYGSGKQAYQHARNFMTRIKQLERDGHSETEIAEIMGIVNRQGKPSTTRLRTQVALAKSEEWMANAAKANNCEIKVCRLIKSQKRWVIIMIRLYEHFSILLLNLIKCVLWVLLSTLRKK